MNAFSVRANEPSATSQTTVGKAPSWCASRMRSDRRSYFTIPKFCTVRCDLSFRLLETKAVKSLSLLRLIIVVIIIIIMSKLCQPDAWPADIDDMADMYDSELYVQLDQQIPMRHFVRRQRPSDPWFDKECRAAKRLTRRLERSFSSASRRAAISTDSASSDAAAAVAKADTAKTAWYNQRRLYRQLRRNKSADFWHAKFEANQSDPHKLWRLVDDLLGRGRTPASSAIDVEVFSQFFAEKVAKVRSSTADAPAPAFTRAPHGVSFQQFRPLTVDDVITYQCWSVTFWQVVICWSNPNVSAEADRRCHRAVYHRAFNRSFRLATFQPHSRRHLSLPSKFALRLPQYYWYNTDYLRYWLVTMHFQIVYFI